MRGTSYWDALAQSIHKSSVKSSVRNSINKSVNNQQKNSNNPQKNNDFKFSWDAFLNNTNVPTPQSTLTLKQSFSQNFLPNNVKMLARDFIHNSLYHPSYGYFSKSAIIFSPPQPIQFNKLQDNHHFMNHLASLYSQFEQNNPLAKHVDRQVWHTPSELFKPHYGNAIAKYILSSFKSNPNPPKNLIIFEAGAGNGTLMSNILDYIAQHDPTIYESMQYNIVEISNRLTTNQSKTLSKSPSFNLSSSNKSRVKIFNQSILDWNKPIPDPCFFIAIEMIDNFAHDVVRYSTADNTPLQGTVIIDQHNDFHEAFEPITDPLLSNYLSIRSSLSYKSPVTHPSIVDSFLQSIHPFPPTLSQREFIPTHTLSLFNTLKTYFPNHRLILSDFDTLPDTIPGHTSPVVQTRYNNTMIPCTTYLVHPGYFDIFFPTDFNLLCDVYRCVMGDRKGAVVKHHEFMKMWCDLDATRTRSGDNPVLMFYDNFKIMVS